MSMSVPRHPGAHLWYIPRALHSTFHTRRVRIIGENDEIHAHLITVRITQKGIDRTARLSRKWGKYARRNPIQRIYSYSTAFFIAQQVPCVQRCLIRKQ
jgi:hypothetical protein